MNEVNVFTYGTLKRGFHNHFFISDGEYLGDDVLEVGGAIDLGFYPAIVLGSGIKIEGELYRVNNETLKGLDYLEGYNEENPESSHYMRSLVTLESGIEALVYHYKSIDSISREGNFIWNKKLLGHKKKE